MPIRSILLFVVAVAMAGCSGGDKHLPSSNPPEYDPKKVYTAPAVLPSASAAVATPTEFERLKAQLESLEAGQTAKGEGKKVPFDPNWLPQFKGGTTPCEALSRLAPGLGSTQLFEGKEGAALKKALGADADGIAQRMDEQVSESLKQSLGPGAANCPISIRPHKSSSVFDLIQRPRLVLAHTTPGQPLLLTQTTVPETSLDDYDVEDPPMHTENAPPGWVGYTTTDTMMRIGKQGRTTEGIREKYNMIIAPKAKECPHLEGPDQEGRVDGTFEWSFEMFRANRTQIVLYRRHVVATLKGKVDDDAKLQHVDFNVTVTLQHIGTVLAPSSRTYGASGRFTPEQGAGIPQELKIITVSGFSEGEAEIKDAQLLGTLTALMAYFSGPEYSKAQAIWNHPNTCVEMIFVPATKTKKFVPSASTPVKTELRTKKEQTIVPAKFKEAKERPREGNGNVTPREQKSERDRPATFTYQAPATGVRHSGFRVEAVSRAGIAEALNGEWELADALYVLEFQSRIVDSEPTAPAESVAAGTVSLTFSEEKGMYRGTGTIGYQTGPPPNRDPCSSLIMGHGTTRFDVAGMFIKLPESTGPTASHVDSADIELHYLIHPTNETERPVSYHLEGNCAPGKPLPLPFFYAHYAVARGADEVNLLKGWTYIGRNGVVAKKVLRGYCGDSCEDHTVFTLKEADEQTLPSR